MALPKFLQPYLASYDLSKMDVERDREIIITQILNKGDDEALTWLGKNYSKEDIKKIVAKPIRGMWLANTLSYWTKILGVGLSQKEKKEAVINLNPR
ncbi:MAG: hypothetical protein WBD86_03305 [Microgenomates group bacterium]